MKIHKAAQREPVEELEAERPTSANLRAEAPLFWSEKLLAGSQEDTHLSPRSWEDREGREDLSKGYPDLFQITALKRNLEA